MPSWSEFAAIEPDLAERAKAAFDRNKHKTMATIRQDGSPRISGTEIEFKDGELTIGSMGGARKADDLRRDPRVAIHSASVEPDEDDPSTWPPDAKVSGRAVEITDAGTVAEMGEQAPDGAHFFRIDVNEVVVVGIGDPADHIVVDFWTPATGRRSVKRT
jgi:hypothetical protein